MPFSRLTSIQLLICAAIAAPAAATTQEPMLAKGGQDEAAIVIAPDASEFARWLASELAGHLQKLSGAELPIVTSDKLRAQKPLIVLGGPQSNPLAAAAEEKQLVKFAGLKPEGAWNPSIRCQSFYERYLHRLYGPDAQQVLLNAFLLLEENEKALGWHGRRGIFSTYARSCTMGVGLRDIDYQQEKPDLDRAELEQAISTADAQRNFWERRAAHCGQALELLRQARSKVPAGSRDELDYVIYKTENFVTVFQELAAVQEAQATFDRALLHRSDGNTGEAGEQLELCRTALHRAGQLVRQAAEQMIPYARIDPTERHILWIINKSIPSHDAARHYVAKVVAMHDEKYGRNKP